MTAPDPAPAVLIAALSGRALAAAARRAGYRPLVADMFADQDTTTLAEATERVPGSLARGLASAPLLAALNRLATAPNVQGIVLGSGFEHRPRLLQSIARRHTLLGNPVETVTAIKDPFRFAATCARANVPHPEIRPDRPTEGTWLSKRAGGSGGTHISPHPATRPKTYYQRRVAGEPVSSAFLAAAGNCRVLGFSRQWPDPAPRQPFRYGGAARPAPIPPARAAELEAALHALVSQTNLRGLNSADFLLRDDSFDILEINPRPGATLDLFADAQGTLFRLHMDAWAGRLPDAAPSWPEAAAAAIVYAPTHITVPSPFTWPAWTADRQTPGETVPKGAPLCTVLANAADAQAAERLARHRTTEILARTQGHP
jgi:predicted ATP-grasp superfamily ATP-dependent carboligase